MARVLGNNVIALEREPVPELPATDQGIARDADSSALFARCRAGDPTALADLYRLHSREALHFVRHAVHNSQEAEDILQEVFVEVGRTVRLFEGRSSFSAWLRRVCVRTAVRHMKRRRRQIGEDAVDVESRAELPAPSLSVDSRMEDSDRGARIRELLEDIAPKKRMVLVLHDIEGTSPKEIAKLVGAPVLTVRTRLFYARRELAALAQKDPALADYFVR